MIEARYVLRCCALILAAGLAACAGTAGLMPAPYHDQTDAALDAAVKSEIAPGAKPAHRGETPAAPAVDAAAKPAPATVGASDARFDIAVNNAPVRDLLLSIVSGTRYSMVVHPDLVGTVSLELKETTVPEVLEVLRDVYGYDFQIRGNRIMVESGGLETRVFNIDYLSLNRTGRTDLRVTSGSLSTGNNAPAANPNLNGGATQLTPLSNIPGGNAGGVTAQESSRVTTTQQSDIWQDLNTTLKMIVGTGEGRQVVISPPTGTVVVRAMPRELISVTHYLRTLGVNIGRQVMLEAKIIDVELSDGQQQGINWAAFHTGNNARFSGGQLGTGSILQKNGGLASGATSVDPTTGLASNSTLAATPGSNILTNPPGTGGLLGLAFQTSNFAALIDFLETQGKVHILSSPRIATINNQKAVIKVGTDDFFVTNVTTTTVATGTGSTSSPSVTVQPFFSGIALDVTAHIDENDVITLHVHPQVSQVTEKDQVVNLGQAGTLTLPLASSAVSEADSIVRIANLNIAAIGGLMSRQDTITRSGIPGASDLPVLGNLFRQSATSTTKRELVILIKPTVIHGGDDWDPITATETARFDSARDIPVEPSAQ